MKKNLRISHLGQIADANMTFGDLTILVGPQATGKSIFVQTVKLVSDAGAIMKTIKRNGFDWEHTLSDFLSLYYGEGMSELVTEGKTEVVVDGKQFDFKAKVRKSPKAKDETVFLIPAQRVLTLHSGWPRAFLSFDGGDPFAVKHFSEELRLLMESGLGRGSALFPQRGRLQKHVRTLLSAAIFNNAHANVDAASNKKRIILTAENEPLPYMVWSAGQREFMPLLLGLYWLLPSSRITKREGIEWVIIEEPEMGLHPEAIVAQMHIWFDLLKRGYKLIVSTHCPTILDVVWALQALQKSNAGIDLFLDLFDLKKTGTTSKIAGLVLQKHIAVYYFQKREKGVVTKDITSLNPGDDDEAMANWGGLSWFSGKAADAVARAAAETGAV